MERNDKTTREIKCPTCKGKGFYSVDYALAKEEMHVKCEDCNGKGNIDYEKR